MPFKMALFGAGKWSRNIARVLTARGDVKLEAALVRDLAKPRDWLDGVPVYSSLDTLLATHRLDGVVICTPPASHAELCLTALDHGVPCFVEKPATLSLADMKRIQAKAESRGLPVVVDHIHLHSAPFRRLLSELKGRAPPTKVIALAGNTSAAPRDCSILWDWGPHDVGMCLACLGPGQVDVERLETWPAATASYDSARAYLEWNGVPVRFRVSQALVRKARAFIVRCENEVLLYTDRPVHSLSRWRRSPNGRFDRAAREVLSSGGDDPLGAALESFIVKAKKRTVDRDELSSAVEVTRILEMLDGYLSH